MMSDLFVGFNNLLTTKATNATIFSEFRAPFQVSLFLTILFISSIFYSFIFIKNENRNFLIFLVLPAIFIYIIFGSNMQYILSSLSIFSILSSLMIFNLINKIQNQFKLLLITLLTVLFIISPLSRSLYYLVNYNYDNRLISAIWINKNIEKDKKISLRFPPTNWDSVPFNYRNFTILNKKNILDSIMCYWLMKKLILNLKINSFYIRSFLQKVFWDIELP